MIPALEVLDFINEAKDQETNIWHNLSAGLKIKNSIWRANSGL